VPSFTVERLDICKDPECRLHGEDSTEDRQLIELLHPFSALKDLYLSKERFALALVWATEAFKLLVLQIGFL
jgi:hypothetical protein